MLYLLSPSLQRIQIDAARRRSGRQPVLHADRWFRDIFRSARQHAECAFGAGSDAHAAADAAQWIHLGCAIMTEGAELASIEAQLTSDTQIFIDMIDETGMGDDIRDAHFG